jgi:hypothetical protein
MASDKDLRDDLAYCKLMYHKVLSDSLRNSRELHLLNRAIRKRNKRIAKLRGL